MDLVKEKSFPANYSDSVLDILERSSIGPIGKVKILGSASIRSQQYSGDYDAQEEVAASSVEEIASSLKKIIKNIRNDCFITDFKIGEVPEWDVVVGEMVGGMYAKPKHSKEKQASIQAAATARAKKEIAAQIAANKKPLPSTIAAAELHAAVQGLYHMRGRGMSKLDFKLPESLAKLDTLKKAKVISEAEYKGAERLLRAVDSPLTFIEAQKGLRFHILRWTPTEILDGVKEYRGLTISLEDAIKSGGLIKLDFIASINEMFSEFSMIYNISIGKNRITPKKTRAEIEQSLKDDMLYYEHRSPFKALKRTFSLAKMNNNFKEIEKLVPILNSDLGRLYSIAGDLELIHSLLEFSDPPMTQIKENLNELAARMGSIYSLKSFLAAEHEILGRLNSMRKMSLKRLKPAVFSLFTELKDILNKSTLEKIKSLL